MISAPTILTSIGIFGTFIGILFGLSEFDVNDISGSVPRLIDGLTTAFLSSVVGMFFALTIRVRQAMCRPVSDAKADASIDDIVAGLSSINTTICNENKKTNENIVAVLSSINTTICNENKKTNENIVAGLSSINTTICNENNKTNQKMDDLIETTRSVGENMANNNASALVEALNNVLLDFNAKINDQFGENFKQLNAAVGEMIKWQDTYRLQMSESIAEQTITTENMKKVNQYYEETVKNTGAFGKTADKLSDTLSTLNTQREEIHDTTESLATLVNSAKTGIPDLERKINALVSDVTTGIHQNSKKTEETIILCSERIDESLTKSSEVFNKHIEKITKRTETSVDVLHEAMSTELVSVLETFGGNLAALSEKFVDDYAPLTDKLHALVKISKDI